jgi:hypothetical protein
MTFLFGIAGPSGLADGANVHRPVSPGGKPQACEKLSLRAKYAQSIRPVETKFVEYESEEAFRADGTFQTPADGNPKGIYLQFEILQHAQ